MILIDVDSFFFKAHLTVLQIRIVFVEHQRIIFDIFPMKFYIVGYSQQNLRVDLCNWSCFATY